MQIEQLSRKPEFAEVCAAWSYSEWGCYIPDVTLQQTVESYEKRAKAKQGLPVIFIAHEDEKMLGMISLKEHDHPDRMDLSPWVGSLIVHRRFQGKGVAEKLFESLVQYANDNFDALYMFTCRSGKKYKLLGWQEIGKVKDTMGLNPDGEMLLKYNLQNSVKKTTKKD